MVAQRLAHCWSFRVTPVQFPAPTQGSQIYQGCDALLWPLQAPGTHADKTLSDIKINLKGGKKQALSFFKN